MMAQLATSWHSFNIGVAALVFVAYFFVDVLYTVYTLEIGKRSAVSVS